MRLEKDDPIVIKAKEKFLKIYQEEAIGLATIAYIFNIPEIDENLVKAMAKNNIIKGKQQSFAKDVVITVKYVPHIYAAFVARRDLMEKYPQKAFRWDFISRDIAGMVRQDIMFRDDTGRDVVENFYNRLVLKI